MIRQATDSASYCLSIEPLAVRLIYFKIVAVESDILLQWRVANPETIEKFIVEKIVGGEWRAVYTLKADGLNQYYHYTDEYPNAATNFYRIRMIEKNSALSYSPVRQLNWSQKNDRFGLYPNPASHQVTVTGDFSTTTRIRLIDASGKLTWDKKIVNNTASVSIDLSSFQPGVYIMQIGNEIKKIIVRK